MEGKSQRKTFLIKPVVLLEKCNGEGLWEDYEQNFEACATVNGWNKEQKAQFLAVSVFGQARELLQEVSLKSSIALCMLLRRLREKYGPGEYSNLHRSTLRARRQKGKK